MNRLVSEQEIDDVIASWNVNNYDYSVHKHGSVYPGRIKFKSKSKSKSPPKNAPMSNNFGNIPPPPQLRRY